MMRALDEMEVRETLMERITAGVPFLGICLGLQALFRDSDEAPGDARSGADSTAACAVFPQTARVPHMGWNELEPRQPSRLLAG